MSSAMELHTLPSLELSCPLAWPSTTPSLPLYPLHPQADTAVHHVKRLYLETLWLPDELMSLATLVPALRNIPEMPLATALPCVFLSLDAVERKHRVAFPAFLREGGGDGDVEVSMMRFALAVRERNSELDDTQRDSDIAAWFDELEKREVQIQTLLRLLLISLPAPPVTSPAKKRKRGRISVSSPTPEEDLDMFTDRLCIWHALGSVMADEVPDGAPERGWVRVWEEDVVGPMFSVTVAAPFARMFHEKLDPTMSAPPSPSSSRSPSPQAFAPFESLPDPLTQSTARSRSVSGTSLNVNNNSGFRRSVSVSSTGPESRRSVSVTRTFVNNNKAWAGREVKMGRRAIGGGQPKSRQSSVPPALAPPPPPPPEPKPFKGTETQTLVLATPARRPPLVSRPTNSSLDEVMETPDAKERVREGGVGER